MHKFFLASLLLVSQITVASDSGYKPEVLVASEDELTENIIARLCCEITSECYAIFLLGPVLFLCCRQEAPWEQQMPVPYEIQRETQPREDTPVRMRKLRHQGYQKSKME